ncbi:MAG: PilN domain-containing protein [Candidatus Binatia bacterium]|nr:PilN domain-containing protein [Candidatus Binatia bacterium]
MSSPANRMLRRATRLDFLDGLGISIGLRSVAFVRLVKRLATVTLHEHRVVPLPTVEDGPARRAALTAAVRSFLTDTKLDTDRVYVSVPRSQAIISRMSLPAAVKGDLAQVIEFEIDRLLPLERDEVYFDHLVREAGDKIEVLLMSMPRRTAAEILDALEEGGARVRSLVSTPIALHDFLSFGPSGIDDSVVTLVDDGGVVELDQMSNGAITASHVLQPSEIASEAAVEGLVAREVAAMGGTDTETRVYGFATDDEPGEGGGLLPAEILAKGRDLVSTAKGALVAPDDFFDTAPPRLVPAIGAALAAVREGSTSLNLLPAEERRAVEEGVPVVTFFLAAVLVVVTLVWVTSAMVKDHVVLGDLHAELARLEPQIRRVHANVGESEGLRQNIDLLTQGESLRNSMFLQELTKVVPADAYLTTFRMRNGRVELEGFAASAADLVPLLEKSRLFKNAQFTSPVTKVQNNQERFSLTTDIAQ